MSTNTQNTTPTPPQDPKRDIYSDPKLAEIQTNDPIYDVIKDNWKNFTLTIVAIFVGIYFIQSFQESYQASMEASADTFQRLQTTYKEFSGLNDQMAVLNADPKTEKVKVEELNKKIADTKSQMDQLLNSAADSREPYKNFAVLYKAIINKESNPGITKEVLSTFANWKEIGKTGSAERLNAELSALQLVRLQLEDKEAADKGKALAKDLALNGEFTSVAAAKVLASFAKTAAEKSEVKQIVQDLSSKHTEQAELLKETLAAL